MEKKMQSFNRRNAIKFGASSLALLLASNSVLAQVKIVVTGGDFSPLPIAIPDFASSNADFGREMSDIVRADLKRSGLFAILDNATLPSQIGNISLNPEFSKWQATRADALVMGQVERNIQAQGSVRVFDVQAGEQVVGKSYSTSSENYRRIAHQISDAIYQSLTGEGGYFDSKIVYVAESGPKANRIKRLAIMDYDGANIQYLTSGKTAALTPRFSPNGQMLTYLNFDDGRPQVFLLNLASGKQQRLGSFGQLTFSPRFSPDNRSIIFSVEQGGTTNLYSMAIGAKRPRQLTTGSAIDTGGSYSPDGSKIVFESDRGGSQQLYIMSASGGGAQRISYGKGSYSTPVWSPKGDLIAYTKQLDGQFHIGIMKLDGSGERVLASSFHMEGPTWSPNGRVIMYFSDPGGNNGPSLYSIDIWGRNQQKISTPTFASDPAWSPLLT